jgi:peptide/nickel transport system substrate-binding protein
VNPVIASSETDLGLVRMVYSNIYDVADHIDVSPDLRTWTVHLKENVAWQDGQKLTSDDIIFTVESIQDPDAASPLAKSWQGVAVNRVSELEVQFSLANPYALFGDNLKSLYILPKHLFAQTPPGNWRLSDYNLKPVGSGPYRFDSYGKDMSGFISAYHLQAWEDYFGPKALIENYNFHFYNDTNALVSGFNSGEIDGFGNATPEITSQIARPFNLYGWRSSAYYAVFFNQSKNIALQDPAVREALSEAVDRNTLIENALGGKDIQEAGVPSYAPISEGAPYFSDLSQSSSLELASTTLTNAGWLVGEGQSRSKTVKKSSIPLTIDLSVPQIDFLSKTADYLKARWQSIGVQVNITTSPISDIVNDTIKNRNYEALLFGNVLGPSSDLYSFWDSSERFAPGLNLAIYSDKDTDAMIEDARASTSTEVRAADLASAEKDITGENPATFLYSPDYLYVAAKNVQGISTDFLADPADRLREAVSWYLNTARVLQ